MRLVRALANIKEVVAMFEPDNSGGGEARSLLLFVAGMGAGGFLVALLFAFAHTGHILL